MEFTKFITEGVELLAAALFILGVFLKNLKRVKDEYIPFVLLGLAIALKIAMSGVAVESVLDAIFATGSAVLVNQLFKQGNKISKGE